ncbi:hypothetical protein FHS77_001738 [Paenochrobactrum gallinarii]|uniref:Uncharacterized protein n=1 Tax=Paenochrobactrum gallinarii TaxID=643673 RepID=A0A841M4U9_9HYPH|nr:hypothetical protein [Paenochrobactrum gallinarii]MBB6261188.1 hypothetical protein [Paenochrobactrum gallinarii]
MKQSSGILILKILGGYFLTTLVALICLFFVSAPQSFLLPEGIENPVEFIKGIGAVLLLGWILTSFIMAIPCAIFIVISEFFSLKHRLPYLIFGAGLGVCILYYNWLENLAHGRLMPFEDSLLKLTGLFISGAICGLIYWKIAGRNAGTIKQRMCSQNQKNGA